MAMDSGASARDTVSLSTAQPGIKKRKIRKGTRSCWECKRRKNRCTWSVDDGKCDGCFHRGTRCIGQEFPEEHSSFERRSVNRSDEGKIKRLEALVEQLSRKIDTRNAHGDGRSEGTPVSVSPGPYFNAAIPSSGPPSANDLAGQYYPTLDGRTPVDDNGGRTIGVSQTPLLGRLDTSPGRPQGITDKSIPPISRALVEAWPSEHHRNATLDINVGSLHPALSAACSGFQTPPSPKDVLELPPPGATPVAIARKLLILGTYLQAVSSQSEKEVAGSCPDWHAISSRAIETVSRLITHNDSLPESLEVIECLIIESQYHNYMGNIRRAWIILRRAMAMAQMLGLDKILPRNGTTDGTKVTARRETVWFLLVHFDQYLSLMLGISPSLAEYSKTNPGLLESCTPSERMSRLHSMAAGRILERNRVDIYNIAETKQIDKILQDAAACMPAQWWLPPVRSDYDDEQPFVDRLMVHFAHYNILLQAHLPYTLHSLSGQQYCYCMTTVISCCREMLTRFTTFRRHYPTVSYCRGLDIFAFIASIALCLLHIRTGHQSQDQGSCDNSDPSLITSLLAHQRLTHRGLMEQALQNVERIAQVEPSDRVTSTIAPIFRKLLAAEGEAFGGVAYNIHLPSDTSRPTSSDSRGTTKKDDTLYLEIPFCGTIRVERANPSDSISTEVSGSFVDTTQMMPILLGCFPPQTTLCSPSAMAPRSLQVPGSGQQPMATEGGHAEEQQPDVSYLYATTTTMTPPTSGLQPMPYSDNEESQDLTSTPGQLAPDMMGDFEDRSNPALDTDFLERFWDVE